MKTVDVKINGQPVQANAGGSILDAAKLAGIRIPALCIHPDLQAWALAEYVLSRSKAIQDL